MTTKTVETLLWWLPALILAAAAGFMPETFLENPFSTIPHEAAFVPRFWMIITAFVYVALVAAVRLSNHWRKPGITNRCDKPNIHRISKP